jgi:hypothetical protein
MRYALRVAVALTVTVASASAVRAQTSNAMPVYVMHDGDGGSIGARFVSALREALRDSTSYVPTSDPSHAGLFAIVGTLDPTDALTVASISLVINSIDQSFLASSIHTSGRGRAELDGRGVLAHIDGAVSGAGPHLAEALAVAARLARRRANTELSAPAATAEGAADVEQ